MLKHPLTDSDPPHQSNNLIGGVVDLTRTYGQTLLAMTIWAARQRIENFLIVVTSAGGYKEADLYELAPSLAVGH